MRFRMGFVLLALGMACAHGPSAFEQLSERVKGAMTKGEVSRVMGSLPRCSPSGSDEMCEWRRMWGGGVGYVAVQGGIQPVTVPTRELVTLCTFHADGSRDPGSCSMQVQ